MFIKTKKPNQYIVFTDNLFEESNSKSESVEQQDIIENYLRTIEGKPASEILTDKNNNVVMSIPLI